MTDQPALTLTPTRSDLDLAADIRQRTLVALGPLTELMQEAAAAGMLLQFQIGFDQFGRPQPVVKVIKEMAS